MMLQDKQKPYYCAEHQDVNVEVTWTESGYTYPERSGTNLTEVRASAEVETIVRTKNNILVVSEVSRGHSKPETSSEKKNGEVSRKDEGLNVRKAKKLMDFMVQAATTETL